jgi:hypothetical protein
MELEMIELHTVYISWCLNLVVVMMMNILGAPDIYFQRN